MAIKRLLPKTDVARKRALTSAFIKKENPGPDGNFLTSATDDRLTAIEPDFKESMQASGTALAGQSGSTSSVINLKMIAQRFISHYIQVFNLGVTRGVYPKAHRAFYQLDVNSESLPSISTEQQILEWGQNIEVGDDARVSAGGAAMGNPTTAQVKDAVTAFSEANIIQSTLKDTYDDALETTGELRPEADKVIKKVWDEVETFYNEEEAPSKRRNAREWGVIYVSDLQITIHITVTDSVSSLPVEGVKVELLETSNDVITNAAGMADMLTNISADECSLLFTRTGYDDLTHVLDIETGTEFNVEVALNPA